MTIKRELTALQKDITAIGKKLDNLLKAVEKNETKPTKASNPKAAKPNLLKRHQKHPQKRKL